MILYIPLTKRVSLMNIWNFKNELVDFSHSYDSLTYSEVYSFKYSLQNSVLKLANSNFLESLRQAQDEGGLSTAVKYCTSSEAGIVSYWVDGYENFDPASISMDVFDERKYEKTNISANQLRAQGDVVYKLSESEDWYIIFPIKEADAESYEAQGYILTRFLRNQYESWGKVSIIRSDKDVFC